MYIYIQIKKAWYDLIKLGHKPLNLRYDHIIRTLLLNIAN